MKTPSPRQRYRNELRAIILEAAREAFLRDGFESLSMRTLADRIGCSHGNLYLHFKNKEALFDSLVDESYQQFVDGFRRLLEAGRADDPVSLVRSLGHAYVEFGLRNPGAYEFVFVLRRPGAARRRRAQVGYDMLRGLVERCIAEKRFQAIDVDVAAQALWAAVHGITSLLVARPRFPWADKKTVIARVIDSSIDSLLRKR